MNYTIILIEAIVMVALFTAMIIIPLVKNPVWWIADYPEEIQEEYFNRILRTQYGLHAETGRFGADMKVDFVNDNPVTIILNSADK